MITTLEFIIASLVISICVSAITGTLVFCILKKKYNTEIDNLEYDIEGTVRCLSRLQDRYVEHMAKYH